MSHFPRRFLALWSILAIVVAAAAPRLDAPTAILLVGIGAGQASEDEIVKVESGVDLASSQVVARRGTARSIRRTVVGRLASPGPRRTSLPGSPQGTSRPLRVQLCRLTC